MRNHIIMIEQSQAKGGLVIGEVKARRKGIVTDFGPRTNEEIATWTIPM